MEYADLEVTTQTWVVYSNVSIDNDKLFAAVECKRLRSPLPKTQRRMIVNEGEDHLADGDVVFAEYLGAFEGQLFRRQKEKQMRNCATVIMKIGVKFYNVKISKKGNFQITGCTSESTARRIVEQLWRLLNAAPGLYEYQPSFGSTRFFCYLCCRMCNTRFQLESKVDLQALNNTIKMIDMEEQLGAPFTSTYEPSIGYGGVNIKVRAAAEELDASPVTRMDVEAGAAVFRAAPFSEYLAFLPLRERNRKSNKVSRNSFIVFHSGMVIMSGSFSEKNRADSYRRFRAMVALYGHQFLLK